MRSTMARDAGATLDAWRERGADHLDPVRFHFIAAMARRAAGHSGDARRILDDRLSSLLAAYGADLERAAGKAGSAASSGAPVRGPLGGLNDYIAGHAPAHGGAPAARDTIPVARGAIPARTAYPVLDNVLDDVRQTWSRVSADRQLRESLEQVPDNAGPLNSNRLVHRSLALMRELSPGYLHQFLSYVDALSWMEQMNGGVALTGKDAPKPGNAGKGARGSRR